MTPGIGYALGAMLLFGIADLVYKRGAAAGAAAHQFLMVQAWFFAPSVTLYALFSGALRFNAATLWGTAVGLCVAVGYYNFAASLRSGSVSTNATIFRLNFAVTVVLAISLLGEPLTAFKIAGLALAVVALRLLLAAPAHAEAGAGRERRASLVRVLIATVAVGIAGFLYKLGLRGGATPAALVVAQASVVVTVTTAFAAFVDRGIRPARVAWRQAPIAAVLLAFAFLFMVEGLARGQASIVVPVAQMGFVVAALLGFALLRERVTVRKVIGLAAALGALASFAHG